MRAIALLVVSNIFMTVQTFYFFYKKVVWTAPISTPLKLI
jgi:hypothetical protein